MIYFYRKQVKDVDKEVTVDIAILGSVKADGKEIFVPVTALLMKAEYWKVFEHQIRLAVLPDNTRMPRIVVTGGETKNASVVVDGIQKALSMVKELTDELREKYVNQLAKFFGGEEVARELVKASEEYLASQNKVWSTVIPVGVGSYDNRFFEYTDRFMQALDDEDSFIIEDNKTKFQVKETDEFFIQIPPREELLEDEVQVESFIPDKFTIAKPYTLPIAYTPDYKGNVPSSLVPLIEGVPSNNDLGIQPNEERYYNALVAWVENNIMAMSGGDTVTEEDRIDALSKDYILALITNLYMLHWGHNYAVPVKVDYAEVESENSDSISKYVMRAAPLGKPKTFKNAAIELHNFINNAAIELNYKAYVRAVIVLGRWGTRKPTCLQYEGYPYAFQLGTNEVVSSSTFGIGDYEEVKVDGFDSVLDGIIWVKDKVIDPGFGVDRLRAPIGVRTTSLLRSEKGEEMKKTTYYSMVDLVQLLLSGNLKVKGVAIDGDNSSTPITVDTAGAEELDCRTIIEDYESSASTAMYNPFYRSDILQDVLMEIPAADVKSYNRSQFHIVRFAANFIRFKQFYDANLFHTSEELRRKIWDGQIINTQEALDLCIAGVLMPIFTEVSKQYMGDPGGVLNLYLKEMVQVSYTDELSFYTERIHATAPIQERYDLAAKIARREMKKLESFSETETPKVAQQPVEAVQQPVEQQVNGISMPNFIQPIPEGLPWYVIKYKDKAIAYCAFGKDVARNQAVLYTSSKSPDGVEFSPKLATTYFCYLMRTLYFAMIGRTDKMQVFFDSIDSMKAIISTLSKLSKEGL